jgi:DNA-binding PadR family transcriptional regulator
MHRLPDSNAEGCGHGPRGYGHHGPFGKHGFKGGPWGGMGGMGGHGAMGGFGRARRGDIRTAVLRLLAEQPMHGYQIIQELSERSGGAWSPSAGSVYPTLQMLADEGLVSAEETGGKKVFSLTDAGKAEVAKTADKPAPWEQSEDDSDAYGYRQAAMSLFPAVGQVAKTASPEQLQAATEILVETRKKLYAILAEG